MPEAYNGGPVSHVTPQKIERLCAEAERAPPGCFVEFGVYQGGSAFHLARVARAQGRALYLFDTFCGMPFQGPRDKIAAGDFHDTSVEQIQALIPDAILCAGVFPASMIDLPPVALAHIDCDQEQSLRAAWAHLRPRMAHGGVMIFDDLEALPVARIVFDEVAGNRIREEAHYGLVRC